MAIRDWSQTAASNTTLEGINVAEGQFLISSFNDVLRAFAAAMREVQAASSIASAATPAIGAANAEYLDVTGTTTITGFDTMAAGVYRVLRFAGALTLTHNATSLILPTGASITTAAGDLAAFRSLGSGNWRCEWFTRADGAAVNSTITVAAGTAAAPSVTTTGDTNTGVYFPAADTIGATTNGSERLRINSTGQVLIGYTDAIIVGGVSNQGLQVTGGASQRITTVRYGNDTNPASIFMGHSRAAAAGSNTIVQSGDQLGAFRFLGDDGTQFTWAATISGEVDGAPGVNDMPGRLVFSTTPDGASNPTERMRITSAGNIVAGASAALATTATDGFLYVPTCAGTPTGVPTAITGMSPIVVNTTNNKLYFYSGGAWRDAGP